MEQEKHKRPEKKSKTLEEKTDEWIEKAESFIDDTAEMIHNSDPYRKVGKQIDKSTQSLLKKAGRWWGKMSK